jgi:hypothetical protein
MDKVHFYLSGKIFLDVDLLLLLIVGTAAWCFKTRIDWQSYPRLFWPSSIRHKHWQFVWIDAWIIDTSFLIHFPVKDFKALNLHSMAMDPLKRKTPHTVTNAEQQIGRTNNGLRWL